MDESMNDWSLLGWLIIIIILSYNFLRLINWRCIHFKLLFHAFVTPLCCTMLICCFVSDAAAMRCAGGCASELGVWVLAAFTLECCVLCLLYALRCKLSTRYYHLHDHKNFMIFFFIVNFPSEATTAFLYEYSAIFIPKVNLFFLWSFAGRKWHECIWREISWLSALVFLLFS